jgi:hypothetical protein
MWEDIDLSESFECEEGETLAFPLSGAWQASVFNLLIAWEDCTGEWTREACTILLIGGGAGRDKLGQPRNPY